MNAYAVKLRRNDEPDKNDFRMLSSSCDHDAIATAREIAYPDSVALPRGDTRTVFIALCASVKNEGPTFGELILRKSDRIFDGRCKLPVYTPSGQTLVAAFKSNLTFIPTLPECAVSSGLLNSLNPCLIDLDEPFNGTQSKQDAVREIIKCIAPTLPECAVSSGIENFTNPYLIDFSVGGETVETSWC